MVPDPTALEGSLLVQAKERNGAFIMQWLPLVLAPALDLYKELCGRTVFPLIH